MTASKITLTTRGFLIIVAATALQLAAGVATAHRSAAAVFTDEDIVIEGYVTRYLFKNPHVSIYLNVVDENGEEQQWMATGPATPSLHRQGWTKKSFEKGQYLCIAGKKGRNNRPMVLLMGGDISAGRAISELNPADGSVIRVVSNCLPRLSGACQNELPSNLAHGTLKFMQPSTDEFGTATSAHHILGL